MAKEKVVKKKKQRKTTTPSERSCPVCGSGKAELLLKTEFNEPWRLVFRYRCVKTGCRQVFLRKILEE